VRMVSPRHNDRKLPANSRRRSASARFRPPRRPDFVALIIVSLYTTGILAGTNVVASSDVVFAINLERARLKLPKVALDTALTDLAQELALKISAEEDPAFEPPPAAELLARARAKGYLGLLVQALMVSTPSVAPREVVEISNDSIEGSEFYRRHEVHDVGVGMAARPGSSLYVLVVGVPRSNKHEPGATPREVLIDELLTRIDRERMRSGLTLLERSADLDSEAQRLAVDLLTRATDSARAVQIWFERYRAYVLRPGVRVGAGLASRAAEGGLEATWVLVLNSEG
jgi:hypothetical protein